MCLPLNLTCPADAARSPPSASMLAEPVSMQLHERAVLHWGRRPLLFLVFILLLLLLVFIFIIYLLFIYYYYYIYLFIHLLLLVYLFIYYY